MDPKTATFFRSVLGNVNQVLCSYDPDQLESPWKEHYLQLKSDYDSALKDLPESDKVPLALDANRHLQCLYSMLSNMNGLVTYLKSTMAGMKPSAQALNSAVDAAIAERIAKGELVLKGEADARVTAAVDAEITRRTTEGLLIPKDTHSQLCSAARDGGIKQGRDAARAELTQEREREQLITQRKESLQTASLPGVTTDVEQLIREALGGSEEQFNAFKATAQQRLEKFKSAGVVYNSQNPVFAKVYLPEDQFKVFEGLFMDPAIVGGHEPFAKGPAAGTQPTGAMLV
jgi:hypothetical protein